MSARLNPKVHLQLRAPSEGFSFKKRLSRHPRRRPSHVVSPAEENAVQKESPSLGGEDPAGQRQRGLFAPAGRSASSSSCPFCRLPCFLAIRQPRLTCAPSVQSLRRERSTRDPTEARRPSAFHRGSPNWSCRSRPVSRQRERAWHPGPQTLQSSPTAVKKRFRARQVASLSIPSNGSVMHPSLVCVVLAFACSSQLHLLFLAHLL